MSLDQANTHFSIVLNCLEKPEWRLTLDTNSSEHSNSLLQVSLPNKVFLYNLNYEQATEVYYVDETKFFFAQENHFNMGI